MQYANKVILAPMVRVGTLPMRLAALENGADLVFTPEIVDKRIVGSTRVVNKMYGTVDYVKGDILNFRTHPGLEKGRLIFQMGTADADLALQAALTVAQDVDGIDVNCGCPKRFSVHNGMGAALLTDQQRLRKILMTLVGKSGLPVTCKIRILDSVEDTVALCRMVESTGIKALTVHCRTRNERPTQRAHWDVLSEIVKAVSIPVVANGDVFTFDDIARVKEFGVSSVMIARGAQRNPSVFRKEGLLPLADAIRQYLCKCIETNNPFSNTKYTLMQMINPKQKEQYQKFQKARTAIVVYEIFGVLDYYHAHLSKLPEEMDGFGGAGQ